MRMREIWKGVVLAESDDTFVVEGSQYFPRTSLSKEYLFASSGVASASSASTRPTRQ